MDEELKNLERALDEFIGQIEIRARGADQT